MSKFVGKFRKNKDYRDDYAFSRDFLNNKKVRNENSEVRKQLSQKDYSYDDSYDCEYIDIDDEEFQ